MQGITENFNAPDEKDLRRTYDVMRDMLISGDRFFSRAYDPEYLIPTVADVPYAPVKLNPVYNGIMQPK